MSLQTDKLFFRALQTNEDIETAVGGRIYSTAVPVPMEEFDKVPVPYIVIENEGTQNGTGTKDDVTEADTDTDTINILIVATDRDSLATLAEAVRSRIQQVMQEEETEVWEDLPFDIYGYSFHASGVSMDVYKPCVYQTLTYICETTT